jgi:hypothetical protein
VKLPAIFGSHVVRQQGGAIPVWGQAEPGEEVTAALGEVSAEAVTDPRGQWRLTLPQSGVARGLTMTAAGRNTVTFEDVAVGQVWLASGQSDMKQGVAVSLDAEKEVAAADYDIGDAISAGVPDGYGSMPVHNLAAKQIVFVYNNWKAKGSADLGIGNAPSGHPDRTFSKSAGSYAAARLQVLVRLTPK